MSSPTSPCRRSSRARISSSRKRLLAGGAVAAFCGFLLYRIAPDVGGTPLYEDEAVAGLIAIRPLDEVLDTVLSDRGGAPLHFVLAHAVFSFEASAEALRWLSVLAAVGAVPVCFDLGRRLGGTAAGLVAAAVAASSTALAVYGSFGRMYALYVLVAALAFDLFVRALRLQTLGAVGAAAATAWLLPAVHPYGAIPALVELVVAVVVWRRKAWPFWVAAVAAVPFLLADLRLADRAGVGESGSALAGPGDAWSELITAVSSFAGGGGVLLLIFSALAVVGIALLFRSEPAVGVLAVSVAVPPALFVLIPAGSQPDLSPRHLFYGLPLWAAAIGVATARGGFVAAAVAVALAMVAPASALRDPRELALLPTETPSRLEAGPGDLLVPYATPFLANLGSVQEALTLPQGPGEEIVATLEHADEPITAVHIALPRNEWTVETLRGPFGKDDALRAAAQTVATTTHPRELDWWYELVGRALNDAVSRYTAAPWQVNESGLKSPSATRAARLSRGGCESRVSSPASSTGAGTRRMRSACPSATSVES